ncbi:MAG: DNA (cytosine-5-)-methyltransferase [Clostridia bacterium]|nr:DNA (cytosine-5-)-methyltransferase [Clostridia bacterium]
MIRYIDLFAGIGGIRLGVQNVLQKHRIASQCVLSSEIDEKACETYYLNFAEMPSGDIRKITEIQPFDLLLGGFPCQPFSYAGKRKGFGDTRGTLFFEIERLLESYKPKAFLLENVRGLYTHDGGKTFETINKKLHDLGYGTYDLLLNSSDFGVPQNRVRLYILGIKGHVPKMSLVTNLGASDSHKFKEKITQLSLHDNPQKSINKDYSTVKDILEDDVSKEYYCSAKFEQQLIEACGDLNKLHGYRLIDYRGGKSLHSWELGKKGKCTEAEIKFMNLLIRNRRKPVFGKEQDGKKLTLDQIKTFYMDEDIDVVIKGLLDKGYLKVQNGKYSPVCGNMSFEVFKFLDPDSIAVTLTSSDCNRLGVIQQGRARRITPRECARLQGFPDSFAVNPIDLFAYKQIGNSVSVPVIEAVMDDFLEHNNDILKWK